MPCAQAVLKDVVCDPLALADCAMNALIEEACLTPKPALVDRRGSGAHRDLDLDIMLRSARALQPTFLALARASSNARPSQRLREQLARIGREGEVAMMRATGGSNAHRGAIWIVGLMLAGAAMSPSGALPTPQRFICFPSAENIQIAPTITSPSFNSRISSSLEAVFRTATWL